MKKFINLVLIFVFALFVVSCGETPDTTDYTKEFGEAVKQTFKDVDLSRVKDNLTFETIIGSCTVTYESSNVEVLSNTGVVTRGEKDTSVSLKVIYTIKESTLEKTFTIVVLAKDIVYPTIKEVKAMEQNSEVTVEAVVARIINGTEKNIPVGLYITDGSDAIYAYGPDTAAALKQGDKVLLTGTFLNYISENEKASAEKNGYLGSRQITITDYQVISKDNPIDLSFAEEKTIVELSSIPITENITSNVYKVICRIDKVAGSGFVNYYFRDLTGLKSFYAYTTANGKDLSWLDEYDGKIYETYISIHNCKLSASGNFWRIIPVMVGNEVNLSNEQLAEYALLRLESQFETKYNSSFTLELQNADSVIGGEVSYKASSNITFEKQEDKTLANISFDSTTSVTITISLVYEGTTYEKQITVELEKEDLDFDTISIALAREKTVGEEVTIAGYIAGFVYLKGTTKPSGFELIDGTSSIAVFASTQVDTTTDTSKLIIGEYVVCTGKYDLYQPRTDYNHNGSIRLNEAEVLYHDHVNHELPTEAIKEVELSELVNNPSDNNVSNVVFLTEFYVERSGSSYVNYYIHDLKNPELSMIVYSQNSGPNGPGEYDWLKEYAGKCVKGYVTLRIGAKSSGKFVWKSGVLQVLEVIESPGTISSYFKQGEIKSLFASEYLNSAEIIIPVNEGETLEATTTSSQVSIETTENGIKVIINKPVNTETCAITFNYTVDGVTKTFAINFTITKTELITLSDFRSVAAKNGPTQEIEGIVSCIVKFAGDSAWGFFVTDETGTIYCKAKANVAVGDKVNIKGPTDLYYGLPQFTDKAVVTVISSGNTVPVNSFNVNSNVEALVNASKQGEQARLGATVYTNITCTIHISSTRCYVSDGNFEANLYYFTSASYYEEAYKPYEDLDGKQVVVDLVAYNVYNNEYTYVIANLRAAN